MLAEKKPGTLKKKIEHRAVLNHGPPRTGSKGTKGGVREGSRKKWDGTGKRLKKRMKATPKRREKRGTQVFVSTKGHGGRGEDPRIDHSGGKKENPEKLTRAGKKGGERQSLRNDHFKHMERAEKGSRKDCKGLKTQRNNQTRRG